MIFTAVKYCSILHGHVCVFPGGGGGLHASCVPMREQKNDEKGTFIELGSKQRCHHLG